MSLTVGEARSIDRAISIFPSLAPVAGTGAAQSGAAVDRLGWRGGFGQVSYSTSGGVTGGTITGSLQDSADGTTDWLDFGAAVTVTIPAGPDASGAFAVPVELDGARRYVRVVVDADPTGGTPASLVAAELVLGGKDRV
ncbi:MAG: hypothetical protein GC191_08130 [Azospirillum sp.]|nr:hypothetical protein [Azospirillum sp.]